ncbi:substrate-binding domain-containing protein [Haloferula sp. A504]|uniref:substrate-binding domain-containing protein n=1 Tax=Haloferula sp. A504 TaxID=3373601 RepID=UPI0031C6037F|nr:GntR family transcriptional regulator [Verrucomicrobiaceae bacterium E54]
MKLLSHAEQVALHLRAEILQGRWLETLPGILTLAREFGVNHNTIDAALKQLEAEGLLVTQGRGRKRRVVLPAGSPDVRPLRVRVLPYERTRGALPLDVELVDRLQEAGFAAGLTRRSLHDLDMDPKRVARFVASTPGDAWIVMAGSREVLEWFSVQPIPCIAMFGRFIGLPIAATSPRKVPSLVVIVRRLVELGHRRIVMLVREERRIPKPALAEQVFLDELAACGIQPSAYNLPAWEDTPDGLHRGLDSLFRHTPPTAMIVCEPKIFSATQLHLARRGITAPEHVSLICDDPETTFDWCQPAISHIRWDPAPVIARVVRWARNVARGKDDRRQTLIKSEWVEGGTVGPPPRN